MRWREDPTNGNRARPDALVRPMRAEDVEFLHMIHGMCLREDLPSHYTRQQIDAWAAADGPDGFGLAARNGERFLIAEMQGAIAGYASWRGDELISTFVVPAAQAIGVGALLVETCMKGAEAAGTPITLVRATLNAIPFFRALDFLPAEPGFHQKGPVRIPYQLMVRPTR